MSQVVPLEATPNQSLSIQLEGVRYDMRFRDIGGMMSVDVSINDEEVLVGDRVAGGSPLIPYKYLESGGGNFVFITELGDIPYWDQFGVTQSLLYVTVEELEAVRVS